MLRDPDDDRVAFTGTLLLVLSIVMALATMVAAPGCNGAVGRVVWPVLIECSAQTGRLVDDVRYILLRDGSADQLSPESVKQIEKLAADYGAEVIACIVEQLVDQWAELASSTPAQLRAARRGQDFLNERGSRPVMLEAAE